MHDAVKQGLESAGFTSPAIKESIKHVDPSEYTPQEQALLATIESNVIKHHQNEKSAQVEA